MKFCSLVFLFCGVSILRFIHEKFPFVKKIYRFDCVKLKCQYIYQRYTKIRKVMVKRHKDKLTEKLIKETAKEVFFAQGKFHATTQEIATEAKVNRALIHYYFRTREQLFELVLQDALDSFASRLVDVISAEDPFKTKVSTFIEMFTEATVKYPYLDVFIVTEINRNENPKYRILSPDLEGKMKDKFVADLAKEIEKGTIDPISPSQFIVNLLSLCSYPLLAKPIIANMFNLKQREYKAFLKERHEIILKLIFKS